MKKVFWGFFFIYLNFNLTLNGFKLNLLPDFVGYLLLYQATGTLAGESGRFQKLRPFSVAMAVYTGILWVGELLGVTGENWQGILLDTAALVVSLYISWNVVQAILEMEESRSADLNGRAVRRDWLVLVIAEFVSVGLLLLCRPLPVGWSLLGPAAAYEGVDLLVQEPVGSGCILGIVVPFVDRLVPQHPDGVECVPGALGDVVSLIELLNGIRKIRIYDEVLSCRETDDLFHRLPALHQSQVVLSPADKVRHVGQAPLHALPCTRVSDISHSNLLPVYGEVNHT